MYEELSNNQLNELFYNEPSDTKEIEGNYLTNFKVWEKNCLRNYDDCRKLGMTASMSREELEDEIKEIIKNPLYKSYERGIGYVL
jgi:branched-subunit amino acid aminotransferase/4-amino-4-deoxychorismate lyase